MKCTVHESRAHSRRRGVEEEMPGGGCCSTQCTLPSAERNQSLARAANRVTDQKKTTASRSFRMVRHRVDSCDDLSSLLSRSRRSSSSLSLSRMNHTRTHTHLSTLPPNPLCRSPRSFSSFSPAVYIPLLLSSPCLSPTCLLCLPRLLARCAADPLFSLVSPHCKVP